MSPLHHVVCLLAGCILAASPVLIGAAAAAGGDDALRNAHARKDCVRGKFKDYYLQDDGGDPPADYKGRVFKLSQDYPNELPPKENYPWLSIPFENGGPVNPEAYLQSLLDYGLEGNVEVDFYVQENARRKWYGIPWMDWNTEITADWPGTDGREFVHGLTHEFDSFERTLSDLQTEFVDTWSGAYFNDRAAFGIGQVYCDPDDPDLDALNPDPRGRNNFADGSFIIKLLFSTVTEEQLPIAKNALEWQANIFANRDPSWRNQGPISRFERKIGTVRLIQIDVSVRDDRSLTGWLLGTFGYNGNTAGKTVWERMEPLGLQWGNNPKVTYAETCDKATKVCDRSLLTEQWINEAAVNELATPPLNFNHLGYAGRLAGPVDNVNAACMGCHQTAGFPAASILPEFSPLGTAILGLDAGKEPETHQSFRMMFYGNVQSGVIFSEAQLFSADYSLQLSMSLQNFVSRRCTANARDTAEAAAAEQPKMCAQLLQWSKAQRKWVEDLLIFGMPGPEGGPIKATTH